MRLRPRIASASVQPVRLRQWLWVSPWLPPKSLVEFRVPGSANIAQFPARCIEADRTYPGLVLADCLRQRIDNIVNRVRRGGIPMRHADIDNALSDPGFFVDNDPHPLWRQLREEDPIHWTEGQGRPFWSITRYDDVVAVATQPSLFTSSQLISLPASEEMEQVTPEMFGSGQMMLMTDPPLHGAMRRAFNRVMLPRAVGRFEVPGPQLVREILDEAMALETCDFVVDVAARLPLAFICEIMGIPRADWPDMFKWGNMVAGNEDPEYQVESGSSAETRQEGSESIGRYCLAAALERRGEDGEDLLSVLGNARLDGRLLTNSELAHNGLLYVGAGLETTRNAISAGLLALLEHPDQLDLLIEHPEIMSTAVQEILRWSSPVTHFVR